MNGIARGLEGHGPEDRGHEPCHTDNGEVKSAEITETTQK